MSIEYYVALDKARVPSPSRLNDAARTMGIPLEVEPSFADLSRYGFQPARFAGHPSGVEAGLAPVSSVRGTYEVFDATAGGYDSVLTLAFGSNAREGAVAMAMSAVLGDVAGAVTYSTEDGRFVDQAELITWMNELEAAARTSEMAR